MKITSYFRLHAAAPATAFILFAVLLLNSGSAQAGEASALLDDFSDPARTSTGNARILVTDTSTGGNSQLRQTIKDGVLTAEGEINPARGQPGWVSLVLLFSPDGAPADLSRFEGIRLRVRVRQGMLSISANSTEIKNFDYHFSLVPRKPGEIQEVRILFKDMKRTWSEQSPLNRASISSISLTAVDLQKGAFAYDVDEVGFF